jgi:glycosyltransferase involved in cell wall biosynthesis
LTTSEINRAKVYQEKYEVPLALLRLNKLTMQKENPSVSIIMCAYNGLHYTKEAVADILAQTFADWELIIADDGSTDGTREWLQQNCTDPRIRLLFNEKNLGYVANKNNALQQAKGTYLTQLDNDDRSSPDRLQKMADVISKHPDIKLVTSGYLRIDNDNTVLGTITPAADQILNERPPNGYPFWFPSLLIHRSVFDEIGYFDPYFGGIGDDIYWTVKANKKHPIYCLKDTLYSYRNNPDSLTNSDVSIRKLVMPEILKHVLEQQESNGTDLLAQGKMEELKKLEEKLANDKKFMSEQYRIWAAKAIDKNAFSLAKKMLKKAVTLNWQNKSIINTAIYLFRKQLT